MSYLFPAGAQSYADLAREAAQSRLDAGVQYPSDTDAGLELGRQVGLKVIAWAQADGSSMVWSGTVPSGPGKWNGINPVEPLAGNWKTWTLTSGNQLRPGPPPAYDSAQEKAELDEVKNYARTVATSFAAWFWQPLRNETCHVRHHQELCLKKLRLGNSNVEVSELCFGTECVTGGN